MKQSINKNVALLELGGSHTECMHLQIKALKDNGYNIFLICNRKLFDDFPNKHDFKAVQLHDDNKSIKNRLKAILAIRKFFKQNEINTIVINTIEISLVRDLLLFPLPKVRNYVGILHNGKKLNGGNSMFKWYRRRLNKVFVLSKDILKQIDSKGGKYFKTEAFYPIYFPCFNKISIEKPENEFWISIPGLISLGRKDMSYLLDSLKTTDPNQDVRIILLGQIPENEYEEINLQLEQLSDSYKIVKFESRIPANVFDAYMQLSNIIMPLTNVGHYGFYRISGAYNLAYAYKIPLYLDKELNNFSDFKEIALFYDRSKNIINQINDLSVSDVEICKQKLINHPYLNIEEQCRHYIDFIMS